MRTVLTLLLTTFLLLGCQNQVIEDNRALAKTVMAIHDEAMAKMTDMHELKLKLQALEETSAQKPERKIAIVDLQNASKGMMTWMHEYKAPKTDEELEKAEAYLLAEKVRIQQVQAAINKSINQAQELL